MSKFLSPHMVQRVEFAQAQYRVQVPAGMALADAMAAEAWQIADKPLRQYDKIQFAAVDGSFYAEAIVATPPPRLKFALLNEARLSATDSLTPSARTVAIPQAQKADVPAGYEVKHAPRTGWRVFRLADGSELVRDLPNRDAAIEWIAENMTEQAA